ncbi:BTB/POZ protein [Glomus cerebriforme]|uniref:BTB/POZ protein n=1 Tax=Glomus cerebriforme TaxID=658196 RepID=A0A397SDE9_9GLOM|nr:BTB/POZ protein [Glomus cerebriforme]
MSFNFGTDLLKVFGHLLKTELDYNVVIYIGEEPDIKEFHAHHIILRCRSEYFNDIISYDDIEKQDVNGNYIIKIPNIVPQAFDVILRYLYTGRVNFTNKTKTELLNIMIASDELNLEQLAKLSEDFIIERYHQFLRNDLVEIFQLTYDRKSLVKLQQFCLEIICFEPKILFNSDKFINLPAPLLKIILKRDDLNLTGIEIWENLIKWGLTQERKFDQDVFEWNQDDINAFKRILNRFIPLVRFYEISSEDYLNKVKPYEEILSEELRVNFHKIPGYKRTFNIYRRKYSIYISSILRASQFNKSRKHLPCDALGNILNARSL